MIRLCAHHPHKLAENQIRNPVTSSLVVRSRLVVIGEAKNEDDVINILSGRHFPTVTP